MVHYAFERFRKKSEKKIKHSKKTSFSPRVKSEIEDTQTNYDNKENSNASHSSDKSDDQNLEEREKNDINKNHGAMPAFNFRPFGS